MEFEELNVTEDGKLKKKILKQGEGESPKDGQDVDVHYTGKLLDGTKFDSSVDRNQPFNFCLGQGSVIKGWDLGVATMKLGEKALFTIHPDLAYGSSGSPPKIPPQATLQFEVELLGFHDKQKTKWDYSEEERRVEALKFKNEGNDFFKKQKYSDARVKYEETIDYLEHDTSREAGEILIPTYINAAIVCTKMSDYSKAIEFTDKALKLDKKNVKGLFRRAAAKKACGLFDEAKEDLKYALELDPKNADVAQELQSVDQAIAKHKNKEKKMFTNMFSQSLYTEVEKTDYSDPSNPVVFMDIAIGNKEPKRIEFELYSNFVPKTAENFRALCTGEKGTGTLGIPLTYKGTIFHRLIKDFMLQGGDFQNRDGTGGESIYGVKFEDENFKCKHLKRGMLSMANSGKNTNGSQFFITFKKTEWLDNGHVVFGCVKSGLEYLKELEETEADGEKPNEAIKVVDCGEVKKADQ
jgi:peptidylprolyl isomerase